MCDCTDKTNAKLAETGEELCTVFTFDPAAFGEMLYLPIRKKATQRITSRKLLIGFCPFCGEKVQTKSILKEEVNTNV